MKNGSRRDFELYQSITLNGVPCCVVELFKNDAGENDGMMIEYGCHGDGKVDEIRSYVWVGGDLGWMPVEQYERLTKAAENPMGGGVLLTGMTREERMALLWKVLR